MFFIVLKIPYSSDMSNNYLEYHGHVKVADDVAKTLIAEVRGVDL